MTYRVIYRLYFELAPHPEHPPGFTHGINVELNEQGNGFGRCRPRHKARIIDLRVGDEMMVLGRWERIIGITADSDNWLSDERAENGQPIGGFAYKLKDETRTAEELRAERHNRTQSGIASSPESPTS